ncbi:hypothetical protein [Caldimonas tepidiphila]|uniref:hypothetical protein n=1 Tax=Caldimonas tepidiphila TaxID=2315841 RepID=UPI000E5B8005|nr:hypothetical protein [Caldimonas tepidiphila]
MTYPAHASPALRREVLHDALLTTVDQLRRRRAADIPEGYIDDYVALDWLKWDGGALRLTATGENVCAQVTKNLCPQLQG